MIRNNITSSATQVADELNRAKLELAFERQCNSELGRRNAKYVKLLEKFEAHRMSMDTKLHLVLHKLSQLHDIADEGTFFPPISCDILFFFFNYYYQYFYFILAGESESSEIMVRSIFVVGIYSDIIVIIIFLGFIAFF